MDLEDSDHDDDTQLSTDADLDATTADVATVAAKIGWRPLRRISVLRQLPYSELLDDEAARNWRSIQRGLGAAFLLRDSRALFYYMQQLYVYVDLYSLFMSKQDYVSMIQLLLNCMLMSPADFRQVQLSGRVLIRLVRKAKRYLSREDLQIDWRPLYQLYRGLSKLPLREFHLTHCPQSIERVVMNVTLWCNSFFDQSASAEILAELLPDINPFDSATSWALETLEFLLPTDLAPPLYHCGWHLWLSQLLDLWSLLDKCVRWDEFYCCLFSRLWWRNIGHLDSYSERVLEPVFWRLLSSFNLPVKFRSSAPGASSSSCRRPSASTQHIKWLTLWVVAMLGGESEAQAYLDRLLAAVRSYFYASNRGVWQTILCKFLAHLCAFFTKRVNRERHPVGSSWDHYTKQTHKLTDNDIEQFVKAVFPCAQLTVYYGRRDSYMYFRQLSQLCPHLVIGPVIESFQQSVETVVEPHRLTCTMETLGSVVRSAATWRPPHTADNESSSSSFSDTTATPAPLLELQPLLRVLLPGIDANDMFKTMCTLLVFNRMADVLTFVDCSHAAESPQLSPLEQCACADTAGVDDVLLLLLDRLLLLVEPDSRPDNSAAGGGAISWVGATISGDGATPGAASEDWLPPAVFGVVFTLLVKSSQTTQRAFAEKLASFTAARALDAGTAGRIASSLCEAVVRASPELSLRLLLPPAAARVLSLVEGGSCGGATDAGVHGQPDPQLLFNLLLLTKISMVAGGSLVQYRDTLEPVLRRCCHLHEPHTNKLVAGMLSALLNCLVNIQLDYERSWKQYMFSDSQQPHLLIKRWGECVSMRSVHVHWHQPGEAELAWAAQLVRDYVLQQLDCVNRFIHDVSLLNKEELHCRLNLIKSAVDGASLALPPIVQPISSTFWACRVPLEPLVIHTGARPLLVTETADDDVSGHHAVDVRRRTLDTMRRLLSCLLRNRPDDTRSLALVCQVLGMVMLKHGTSTSMANSFVDMLRAQMRLNMRDIGYKRCSASTLFSWARVCHIYRVSQATAVLPSSTLCEQVVPDLLTLSTNYYSHVRKEGQQALLQCMVKCFGLEICVWPLVVDKLSKTTLSHEQLKGLMHLLVMGRSQCLLLLDCWAMKQCVWPLLVSHTSSEKDSIARLIELIHKLFNDYVLVPLQHQFSAEGDCLAERVCQSGTSLMSSSSGSASVCSTASSLSLSVPSDTQRRQADVELCEFNSTCRRQYKQLISRLLDLLKQPTLQWRRHELCVRLLVSLVRSDVVPDLHLTRATLHLLLHSSLAIRKAGVVLLGAILQLLKPAPSTVCVDPADLAAAHTPRLTGVTAAPSAGGDGVWRNWRTLGDRADNAWLQYDSGAAPRSADEWRTSRYLHKMKLGYGVWPRALLVYRQLDQYPPPSPPELTTVVEEIARFFGLRCDQDHSDDQRPEQAGDVGQFDKLMQLLSLEGNKGMDLFHRPNWQLFKALAKQYGVVVVTSWMTSLKRLAADNSESCQKCVCEIIAGVVCGSKLWPYADVQLMWSHLLPLISQCLGKVHEDTATNWITCLNTCVADRDVNRHHWLVESLLDSSLFTLDEPIFTTCVRLDVLAGVVGEFEWRGAEVLQRVLRMISPHLHHDYLAVRRKIGSLLGKIFAIDIYDGPHTISPRAHCFLDTILGRIDQLATVHATKTSVAVTCDTSTVIDVQQEDMRVDCVMAPVSTNADTLAADTQQRAETLRLLQTVCHYLTSSWASRLMSFLDVAHIKLVPALCALESYDLDLEVQRDCIRTLCVLSAGHYDVVRMRALLSCLSRPLQHSYWRVRVAAINFVQALVFNNMFLLMQNCDLTGQVERCVVDALTDCRVEVRQAAVHVLSGLLHCQFIEPRQQRHLLVQFSTMAGVTLPRRRCDADDSATYAANLCRRHAGVLGLCAFVAASPYHIASYLPDVLVCLSQHVNDPHPIQGTVRSTMTNFKRTHHENWRIHRRQFTDDQLAILTDILVSPSYYA